METKALEAQNMLPFLAQKTFRKQQTSLQNKKIKQLAIIKSDDVHEVHTAQQLKKKT